MATWVLQKIGTRNVLGKAGSDVPAGDPNQRAFRSRKLAEAVGQRAAAKGVQYEAVLEATAKALERGATDIPF
jgi:hypothetical protein